MTSPRPTGHLAHRHDPEPAAAPAWVLGPDWARQGLRQQGWILLPLRVFLGVTFCYAGLDKLATPDFFNAASPISVQHQMAQLAPTSPIGPLVDLSLHAGAGIGVLIALGELAIGVGTLLGLRTRWAAAAGALLALTFFLTVSWNTTPYYYGADIVFLFAWTPFVAVGAAGVLSLDGWIAASRTLARPGAPGTGLSPRRAVLGTGAATLAIAAVTTAAGWVTGASPGSATASTRHKARGTAPSHTTAPTQPTQPVTPSGTKIASVSSLQPGRGAEFTDPATGQPAWVVCLAKRTYAAHSAICTHAGCTVNYDPTSSEFVCPCHGGAFNARTGAVLAGPPPAPLPAIPVHVTNGQIYAD